MVYLVVSLCGSVSMASNKKKIPIPISSLSSEEIYAMLDDIDSNYEE